MYSPRHYINNKKLGLQATDTDCVYGTLTVSLVKVFFLWRSGLRALQSPDFWSQFYLYPLVPRPLYFPNWNIVPQKVLWLTVHVHIASRGMISPLSWCFNFVNGLFQCSVRLLRSGWNDQLHWLTSQFLVLMMFPWLEVMCVILREVLCHCANYFLSFQGMVLAEAL